MALRAGWLALMLFVWIIGTILGSTYDGNNTSATWMGTGTGGYVTQPRSDLEIIGTGFNAVIKNPIVGSVGMLTNSQFWGAVYRTITWQWTFVLNETPMFYWIFCFPFVAMGLLSCLIIVYQVLLGNLRLG